MYAPAFPSGCMLFPAIQNAPATLTRPGAGAEEGSSDAMRSLAAPLAERPFDGAATEGRSR
jgi:hypothetical protein